MDTTSEIAIVGGGALGLACAWRLAQSGARVAVFESGQIGREASWAAGGMLAPSPEALVHSPDGAPAARAAMLQLCVESRDLYPDFAAELLELTGVDVELCQQGSPTSDWREPGILLVPAAAAGDAMSGSPSCLWNGRSALWFERDGQVEPRRLVWALRAACERCGVAIYQNAPVSALEMRGARVVALQANGARHATENVVLCAGAWSGRELGLSPAAVPPVRPIAGQMLQLQAGQTLKHIVYGAHCYLIPRRDGRLLVGATVEEVGFCKRVTEEGRAQLLGAALQLAPILRDAPVTASWAGLRPAAPDGLPIVGRGPLENLSYATGHGRNGILLAPRTAELIAGSLARGENVPQAFAIARFST